MAKLSKIFSATAFAKFRARKLVKKTKRALKRGDQVLRPTSSHESNNLPQEHTLKPQPNNQTHQNGQQNGHPHHGGQPKQHPHPKPLALKLQIPEPQKRQEEIVGFFDNWDDECIDRKEMRERRQKLRQAQWPKQWKRECAGVIESQEKKSKALAAQGIKVRDFEMEALERRRMAQEEVLGGDGSCDKKMTFESFLGR